MNLKNDYMEDTEELTFNEEVSDEELHSKLGVDDHIYIRKFFGGPFLVVLGVLLILTSLFALMYGLFNSDKYLDGRQIGVTHSKYKLLVTHTTSQYGGTIDNFSKYNSLDKAYTYSFSVSNNNPLQLQYGVSLTSKGNLNDDVHYQLVRNDQVVEEGLINKRESNTIYSTSISSNTLDKYEIKIWSNTNNGQNYTFKISIDV